MVADITRETLLRLLLAVRQEGAIGRLERLGAFVNAICNNVLHEHLWRESQGASIGESAPEPVDGAPDLDRTLVNSMRKRQIETVLSEMKAKDRELLHALFLSEVGKTELRRRLNVNEDYLRVLLHRAKERFRRKFQEKKTADDAVRGILLDNATPTAETVEGTSTHGSRVSLRERIEALLSQVSERISLAIDRVAADPIQADVEALHASAILDELYCLREVGEGFGLAISASETGFPLAAPIR